MMRLLCILPGPQPLPTEEGHNEFWCLSEHFCGYVLSPVWGRRPDRDSSEPAGHFGGFEYYTTYSSHLPNPFRALWNLLFAIAKGTSLFYRDGRYEAIVAYGPFTTAFAGLVVRWLTGARLIVEFPGNPSNSFLLNSRAPGFMDRLKTRVSRLVSPIVARSADHLRLLYPRQLDSVVAVPDEKMSAFHYFTPIQSLPASEEGEPFILCLGGPWFRKGVDVLIEAFRALSDEFGEISLRVHGYTSERSYYENLAAGHDRIHLGKPVPHREALELIRRCRVYACPSRSEGMPRVIVEAMAAGRPVVASDVDGIPFYLQHSVTGLIARNEDVSDLAEKLGKVLRDEQMAKELGDNARAYAMKHLTDQEYAKHYRDMVFAAVRGSRGA